MGRIFLVEYDQFPEEDFVLCSVCKTRIGLVEDHVDNMENGRTAVFNKVFNVQVDTEKQHKQENGKITANTYCIKCGILLGLKLIALPYQTVYLREGRFMMRTNKFVYWNNRLMFDEQDEGASDLG